MSQVFTDAVSGEPLAADGNYRIFPYHEYKEDGSFSATAPYDYISLAISPRYAPKEADELIPVFKEYMHELIPVFKEYMLL